MQVSVVEFSKLHRLSVNRDAHPPNLRVGGAAFGQRGDAVILRKDWMMVGFTDLTYAIRLLIDGYDLVEIK